MLQWKSWDGSSSYLSYNRASQSPFIQELCFDIWIKTRFMLFYRLSRDRNHFQHPVTNSSHENSRAKHSHRSLLLWETRPWYLLYTYLQWHYLLSMHTLWNELSKDSWRRSWFFVNELRRVRERDGSEKCFFYIALLYMNQYKSNAKSLIYPHKPFNIIHTLAKMFKKSSIFTNVWSDYRDLII